jgi:VCBS repeat-containing protein
MVALAAGSVGIASVWTRAAVPAACLGDDVIHGTPSDDKLKGTTGDDVIFGGGGDDVIRGRGGNDILCGRGGNDTIKGGRGNDLILGGGGDDTLKGGPGDDDLRGGRGFDTLSGGVDTDLCDGEVETDCEEPEPTTSPTATPSPTPSATASPTPTPTPPTSPPNNVKPNAAADSFTTDEDQTKNQAAPGVLANDTDPEGEQLTAALVTGASNGLVTLNPNGSFTYLPNGDFNGTDSFTYSAQDATKSSDPATVTINVTPVPDAPSAIAQSAVTNEDTLKPLDLFGSDPDGPAPTVFKITSLPPNGKLYDGNSAADHLILAGELPYTLVDDDVAYEPAPNYFGNDSFAFKANDGGLDSVSAANVSITVVSINDAPTDIALNDNSVDEEEPAGTNVGTLSATDPDAGDIHNFSLASGAGDTDNSRFTIVGGVLKTAQVFDFETQGPFSVRIRTTDAAGLPFEKQFSVTLNDVNDAPVVQPATFSLPENSANGTAVGTPTVNDQDAGQTHTWSITGGNSSGAFAIDPGTGAITVADTSDLDFEATPSFALTVRAEDNGTPAKADSDTVTVNLTNVNETPTDIGLSGASVAENEATGTSVGNLSTTDPDAGDTHTYSLVSGTGDGDNGKFQIDNGVLETAQVFDFETQGPFSVRIRTTDAGNLQYEEVFSIAVTNVNDAPVVSPATVSLDENSANGTAVHTVSATDEDSPAQTLTYSITGGNTGGAFQINPLTGAITVADVNDLDFETNPTFALTVKAEDDGSPAKDDSDTITINLNNLNEAPVVNAATLSLPENSANGTSVGTATFSDQDSGQTHTFAITGGNTGGAFQIDPSTGEITVADSNDVDFETNHPFSLTVQVTDDGSPNLNGSNTVTVNLTNVNEVPTDIALSSLNVPENSSIGTTVGTLSATDPDAGDTHTFSLVSGTGDTDNSRFTIDGTALKTAETFDFETQGPFSIRVRATDAGSLQREEEFSIAVTNVNEAPVVNAATFSLAENSPNGTSVGTASLTDPDAGQTHTWAITGGNTGGAFAINSSTGEITVADVNDVDFETNPTFGLIVQATDNGSPALSDTDTITVNLTNANDAPVVNAATFSLAENSANGTSVGTVTFSDQDNPGQNHVFSLTGGNTGGAFQIDPSTGEITVADTADVDFETNHPFSLAVQVTDDGSPVKFGSNTITVNLTNVNEKPVITAPSTVSAQYGVAKELSGISVSDPDSGSNDITMTLGALDGTMTLDTGVLNGLVAGDITGNGTDSVTITGTQAQINNTLAAADGLTYTSDAGFAGPSDTLAVATNDNGNTGSGGAQVDAKNVTIQFNTPPVATAQTVSTNEDTEKTITLAGTDGDGDPLTFKITSLPAAGKLHEGTSSAGTLITSVPHSLPADKVTYVPPANQNGTALETFGFKANDGTVDSSQALVTVDVTAVDDLPVAVNDAPTVNEDSGANTINVLANDTDVDGGPKTIDSKTNGTNGTVAITNSGADLTYTPNANYCNNPPTIPVDTFTYTLNGGSVGTVSVTVTCVDDAPVAVNDTKTVLEDASATTIDVLANDTDVDGGPKVVNAKTNSTNGGTVAITNAGADLTYTPAANYCNDPELQPAGGNLVETFTYTLNGTPASGGTVTVTVTCVNDPPTADTETFNGTDSALSNFRLDNGTSTAGLDIAPATLHNVLAGDIDIEGDTVTLIAGADCTGTGPFTCLTDGYDPDGPGGQPVERGTVTLETDGDFHYTPPAGHVGSDSFDYRVSDGQPANSEANGTVNITVAGPTTWFVDDSASPGGNGTSASPFQGFVPLTTAGASNHLDDANDTLFVYEGSYSSGIVLENGQKLLGHPHSLDINDTAGRTHTDLVSGAGTAPAISHAANTVVTLGSGNELQDLALGNGTISLAGTSVGTALVRDTSISTTGKGLDINGGTMDMVFSTFTSNGSPTEAIKLNNAAGSFTANGGTLQNAANAVVDITGATQDVTIAGNISDSSGQVISIANTTGGTKDFNGTTTGNDGGSGARINLTSNTGSIIRFDNDVLLNTGTLPAVSATGGGTLHMGSDDNILTTTTGTPLNVVNSTIGASDLIFDSISSNGAANGIVLDNTGSTGNLNVTGTGAAASGGTITSTTGGDLATNQCANPAGTGGVGIFLRNTTGPIFNDVVVNGSSNFGLLGNSVSGFTMDDSSFTGTHGGNENQDEGTVMFCGLTGSASLTDSSVLGGHENGFTVSNTSGTLNALTVSNTDFATSTGAVADDAFHAAAFNNATMNVTINTDSDFTIARGDLLNYRLNNTAVGTLTLDGNDFSNTHPSIVSGGGGITIAAGGGGSNTDLNYTISDNDFRDALGNGVTITTGVANGAGDYDGSVSNNRIGATGVANSGSSQANGLTFNHEGSGTHTASVTGNTIQEYFSRSGIRINPQGTTGAPMRMTIKGNTITEPGTLGDRGIVVDIASTSTTLCLDIGGLGADANNVHGSDVGGGGTNFDIRILTNDASNTVNLPGYVGGANDAAAIQSFLIARNSAGGVPNASADTTGSFGNGGANCL